MNTLDVSTVQKAYSRWAGVYDLIFGRVFNRARRRAIGLMQLGSGARVLEVGVGTGLSLSFFPESCWVAGVDLSRPMLQQAASRIGREELGSRVLIEGDGARLPFANGVFDAALAPFVVSAAPEPVALLREICRVCRPGSRLVILNHFSSAQPLLMVAEQLLSRVSARLLGFRARFPLEPLFESAGLKVEHREQVPPLRYWQVVCCSVNGSSPHI